MTRGRRLVAEFAGTALLLAVVVGSGIMGERLSGGNTALALLANSLATGCGLFVLILALGPVSGAHFNPSVSLVAWRQGELPVAELPLYLLAQCAGAMLGVWLAHLMFDQALLQVSVRERSGAGQLASEFVASFGLLFTIGAVARHGLPLTAAAVAAYITAAYWFTASTSFANPAVTLARTLTDSFAGIRPQDAPGFVLAQLAGAWGGGVLQRKLYQT